VDILIGMFPSPDLFAETAKLENRICFFHVRSCPHILGEIPVHEAVVLCRDFSFFRNHFGTVSGRVIGVSRTKKSTGVLLPVANNMRYRPGSGGRLATQC